MAFSTHDIVPDSPTNNFAVCNKVAASNDVLLSNGNLTFSRGGSSADWRLAPVSIVLTEGKYYCEYTVTGSSIGVNHSVVGTIDPDDISNYGGFGAGTVRFLDDGRIVNSNGTIYTGTAFSTGTVIGLMFDVDANTCDYYRDGTFKYQVTGLLSKILITGLPWHNSSLPDYHFNFGQDPTFGGNKSPSTTYTDANGIGAFYYQPPTGALALCTANLPDFTPTVTGDTPQNYFKAVIWGGNNTSQNITDVGFQPDLVWWKGRGPTLYSNNVTDSIRGTTKQIFTDLAVDEETNTTRITGWLSNGFSIGNKNDINTSGQTYVAWCWKAGGNSNTFNINGTGYSTYSALQTANTSLPASSTSGMIVPSGMSINTDAGFSIIKYTGPESNHNPSARYTIPHGLNSEPEFVVTKSTNNAYNWHAYHKDLGGTAYIQFNLSDPYNPSDPATYNGPHDQNVVKIGGTAVMAVGEFIMYCWHSVDGYSKCGSYIGNDSATGDGPYIHCGFRPAFVMYRGSNIPSDPYSSWGIADATRSLHNPTGGFETLWANRSTQEGYRGNGLALLGASDGLDIDFLSGGFKIRGSNAPTETNDAPWVYIFMAFAEQPFKFSNAR